MKKKENGMIDASIQSGNEEPNPSDEDSTKDFKALYQKEKERAENLKVRAEKAEKKAKVKPEPRLEQTTQNLSSKDILALSKSDIHEEDIDEVIEYAKFKKISVTEALGSDVVKTILSNKSEFRKTAEMTNTGSAKKGAVKISDEALISNFKKGEIPEKGSEEAERLFWARRGKSKE